MTRYVYEDADGRRVQAEEEDFDNPEANPFASPSTVVLIGADGSRQPDEQREAEAEGRSLADMGFKQVGRINPETGHEEDVIPFEDAD